MICLTADLHHMSLKTGNQLHSDQTEMALAAQFVKMMEERDIKGSFFITGKELTPKRLINSFTFFNESFGSTVIGLVTIQNSDLLTLITCSACFSADMFL